MADWTEQIEQAVEEAAENVRTNLGWLQKHRKMPVVRLAVAAGIGPKTYYNVLDGTYLPEFKTLVGLALALNADVADFFLAPSEFARRYKGTTGIEFIISIAPSAKEPTRSRYGARKTSKPKTRRAAGKGYFPQSRTDQRKPAVVNF